MLNNHQLLMWYNRNEKVIGSNPVITAISTIILQRMHRNGDFSKSILTDGIPYDETIDLINEYYSSEMLPRIKDVLWKVYQKRLDSYATKKATYSELKDTEQAYRVVCYGLDNTNPSKWVIPE